jgi:hypothetical protein
VTQSIAAAGVYSGNGGWIAYGMAAGACALALVAILSIGYGTKNITLFDSVLCCGAFFGIVSWFWTKDLSLSVAIATAVDCIGYLPTIRKTWSQPETETMKMWIAYTIGTVCALLSLEVHTFITSAYIWMCLPMNFLVCLACTRRYFIPHALVR